jgi:hypothetical protein
LDDIVKAFKAVASSPPRSDGRIGRRFYLYVSGHGCGFERHRGALFTANADDTDRDHFYVPSYFNWLVDAALFEQYVLWFDACSTSDWLGTPKLAGLRPIKRAKAPHGREMIAHAARFYLKAAENTIGGEPHSIFTYTLLEGLEGAAIEPNTGAVTTSSLRRYLINHMRRHMTPEQLLDTSNFSQEPDFATVDDFELLPASALAARGVATVTPAPAGPPVRLSVQSGDPAIEIFVVDTSDRLVARGLKGVDAMLPAAHYTVRARLGRREWQEAISLDADRTVNVPPIALDSAVPLPGARQSHETHVDAVRLASSAPAVGPGAGASLMVMARWWTAKNPHPHRRLPRPQTGLLLRHHSGIDRFDLAKGAIEGDLDGDRWATRTVSVDPGLHTLALTVDGQPAEMSLTALEGWQTRVFLLLEPGTSARSESGGGRLADVSVLMWKEHFPEVDEVMRVTEAARMALADERSVLSDELLDMAGSKFRNPMMGLYALHLMLLLKQKEALDREARNRQAPNPAAPEPDRPARFDQSLFDVTLANTITLFGEDHPDIRAIRLAAGQPAGLLPISTPPMLWHSWVALVEASNANPGLLSVDIWERVANQILQRPFLIWMRRPAAAIRARTETRKVGEMLARMRQAPPTDAEDRVASASTAPAASPFGGSPTRPPDKSARGHARSDSETEVLPPADEAQKRRLSMELGVPRSVIDRALSEP